MDRAIFSVFTRQAMIRGITGTAITKRPSAMPRSQHWTVAAFNPALKSVVRLESSHTGWRTVATSVARERCGSQPWVSFQNVRVPSEWPEGQFDLIVLSEVLYFISAEDSLRLAALCQRCLQAEGVILLVNWLEKSPDDPCSGDAAAARFIDTGRDWFRIGVQRRTERYRLDMLEVLTP
jgi:hypothetical protein